MTTNRMHIVRPVSRVWCTLAAMIRMIQSNSAGHAKAYFNDALAKADYYLYDQELQGVIHGRLAERLGLTGPVSKTVFHSLCDNRDPNTGQPLTPRIKENRITGYDASFSCPKSLSILHGLSNDDHILTAFQSAVSETMQDIERDSKTRVRLNGQYDDRETGELLWSTFVHQTARPLDGSLPDPQLHAHVYIFNMTYDDIEGRVKAAPQYHQAGHAVLSGTVFQATGGQSHGGRL